MALFFILISLSSAAWVLFALALAWLGGAIYAGATTRWLRATGQAHQGARIAGGTCIIASGITYTLAAISLIVAAVLTVLCFRFAAAALKESLEKQMKK
jgi:heme/copper-type cytochrome/quinol oxidase subunit 2